MATVTKDPPPAEDAKIDLFEDDDEFEEFENEGNPKKLPPSSSLFLTLSYIHSFCVLCVRKQEGGSHLCTFFAFFSSLFVLPFIVLVPFGKKNHFPPDFFVFFSKKNDILLQRSVFF